jgi:hypothetical protein
MLGLGPELAHLGQVAAAVALFYFYPHKFSHALIKQE